MCCHLNNWTLLFSRSDKAFKLCASFNVPRKSCINSNILCTPSNCSLFSKELSVPCKNKNAIVPYLYKHTFLQLNTTRIKKTPLCFNKIQPTVPLLPDVPSPGSLSVPALYVPSLGFRCKTKMGQSKDGSSPYKSFSLSYLHLVLTFTAYKALRTDILFMRLFLQSSLLFSHIQRSERVQ